MSQNFELLKQLEREASVTGRSKLDNLNSDKERFAPQGGCDDWQEEMLRLVQRVFLLAEGSSPHQVVFCGVDLKNSSSAVCARVGQTLASNISESVCLIDANVRSPRLSGIFKVDTTTLASGTCVSVREQCVQIDGNLWLGRPDVLSGDRGALPPMDELKKRLAGLRASFEYVLIDAPGTSVGANAAHLSQVAGSAILVIEANSTRRLSARKAKDTLDEAGVQLLGTVLHNRSFPIPERLYKKL